MQAEQPQPLRLLSDFAVVSTTNKKGLRRAKKGVVLVDGSGKEAFEQQDTSFAQYPFGKNTGLALFAVFDGHAGAECAAAAADIFPRHLRKRLRTALKAGRVITDMTDILKDVYRSVDERLQQYEYEGCTATTAVIWRVHGVRYLQCANVGDSSAMLVRGGQAVALSVDHKLAEPSELRRLADENIAVKEGQTRVGGLAVTRALGDHFVKRQNVGLIGIPHVSRTMILPDGGDDEYLVLASDGLWDVTSLQSAADLLVRSREGRSANYLANKLVTQAVQSFQCNDNVTVSVTKLK